jgi:hypothetical protein
MYWADGDAAVVCIDVRDSLLEGIEQTGACTHLEALLRQQ